MSRFIGILLMPVRVAVWLLVFAPLLLSAAALVKIGEIVAEQAEDLHWRLKAIAKDWFFLTNSKERERAVKAMQENESMRLYINNLEKMKNGGNK